MKKFFNSIGNFFKRIWKYIVDTAWIQPLLIVGLIFGIIFSIKPIWSGIQGLIESGKDSKFYVKNALSYKDLQGKIDEGKDFIVVFRKNGCSACEADEKYIENYAKTYSRTIYTIDVTDGLIPDSDIYTIIETFKGTYDSQASEDKYFTINDDGSKDILENYSESEIATPTLVRFNEKSATTVVMGLETGNELADLIERFGGSAA